MPGSLLAMVAQVSGTGVVAIATDKEIEWGVGCGTRKRATG